MSREVGSKNVEKGDRISVPKLAEVISVAPETVKAWMRKGAIPYVKTPSGHCFIWKEDAVDFVERSYQGPIGPLLKALGEAVLKK